MRELEKIKKERAQQKEKEVGAIELKLLVFVLSYDILTAITGTRETSGRAGKTRI